MGVSNPRNAKSQKGEVDARHRLVASRSQLMRHMSRDFSGTSVGDLKLSGVSRNTKNASTSQLNDGPEIWYLIKIGLRKWWRHHPANIAVAVATPLLQRYAERKPFQLLALSAGVGAALIISKPWRVISVGSFALATLKSSEFFDLVTSLLASGKGETNGAANS